MDYFLEDDFVGDMLEKNEGFSHRKAEEIKKILIAANRFGMANLPLKTRILAAKCMMLYGTKGNLILPDPNCFYEPEGKIDRYALA